MRIGNFETGVRARIKTRLDAAAADYMRDGVLTQIDFSQPAGEAALTGPDSVSWRIFKNPVSLFIGGVTAVLLEFAEPRVRSGVWDHSVFKTEPVKRLKRTGLAAMVTVYGAQSVAERMIAGVRRMHDRVAGVTPDGTPYAANDEELLNWVQATASFGFLEAYNAYVSPLTTEEKDQFYRDATRSAALYGAEGAPVSDAARHEFFDQMTPKLEPSDIVFEFIQIMRAAPALPQPAQIGQRVLIRGAVDLLPSEIRETLGLGPRFGLRPFEGTLLRRMGARADRIPLPSSPPGQACLRLGLPADYLYKRRMQ
ncbi:MAG: oxygenase MpaB family protein [Pseudomonadota bacterium]